MSGKNYWLKNGLLNFIQNSTGVILGFFSFYMLVRMLSKDDFGLWAIFLSITGIVELAKNGFTQEATIKYLSSASKADRMRITTASFILNSIITGIIILVLLVAIPLFGKIWHSAEIVRMLYLYMIVFVATIFLGQFNYIEQSRLRFNGVFMAAFTRQFFFFLYIFICYVGGYKITLTNLAIVQIANVLIATTLAYFYTRPYIKYTVKIDRDWIKKILNFGKYTFGVSLTTMLTGSIDQMMLGSMLSKAASGSFNVAVRITGLTGIPSTAMTSIVFPQGSARIEKEGTASAKYLYEKSVGVVLSILVPTIVVLYFMADFVITFIAGERFADAVPLLQITLITCLFGPYVGQCGTILTAAGKTKINFYNMLFNIVSVVLLNLVLIKAYGVLGAAYAALISSFLLFILTQITLKRLFNINWLNSWKYAIAFYPEFFQKHLKKQA
ncbi:MAG: flippase [Niabella sp.]